MHRESAIQALRRGTHLAAATDCSDPQRAAWVGVYPLDLSLPRTREFIRNIGLNIIPSQGRAYHLRSFEVNRELIQADSSIAEPDLMNKRSYVAFNESELMQRLDDLGTSLEALELPYKSNYPI